MRHSAIENTFKVDRHLPYFLQLTVGRDTKIKQTRKSTFSLQTEGGTSKSIF
ncbi:Uncharacterized protein APZ42_013845 [Daphnia magna]|uniref:Uncharacterized protein n=1 Tax=Daphnia magna TaxID=35525 RepID=A0A162QG89_9CRUS|nr:Uncharacterized protein APZ42_013845 [Daphnia magna]